MYEADNVNRFGQVHMSENTGQSELSNLKLSEWQVPGMGWFKFSGFAGDR